MDFGSIKLIVRDTNLLHSRSLKKKLDVISIFMYGLKDLITGDTSSSFYPPYATSTRLWECLQRVFIDSNIYERACCLAFGVVH